MFKINVSKLMALLLVIIFCVSLSSGVEAKKSKIYYKLYKIEADYKANIGVYAIDTDSGKIINYNPSKRFAYCSTHKVFTAAEILRRYSPEQLQEVIHYAEDDILSYAPVTKEHVDTGMTLFEICEAAVRFSDNTAANLMINKLGGIENFKLALQDIGDEITNPVRIEPEMNEFVPESTIDTSTPKQMALNLQKYVLGDVLNEEQKQILINWMSNNAITDSLIKAGVPDGYKVIDKSGSGTYGTRNDIAIIYPENGKPIVMAIMTNRNDKFDRYDDKLIAGIANILMTNLW